MITHCIKFTWAPCIPPLLRKLKQMQTRARRTIPDMKKRERVFKPGPYRDSNGNARFLGRA